MHDLTSASDAPALAAQRQRERLRCTTRGAGSSGKDGALDVSAGVCSMSRACHTRAHKVAFQHHNTEVTPPLTH
jgi:hypothetical protein